ncbi:MAG: LytTR family transcriptional regulator [Cyclobacteriaceae bacterium]
MKFRFPLVILITLIGLVTFDAFQEKYLLETFNLSAVPLEIDDIIHSHFMRWGVWSLVAVPLAWSARRSIKSSKDQMSPVRMGQLVLMTIVFTILSISLISLIGESTDLFPGTFKNLFVFYAFKKSVIFLFANGLLVLLIYGETQRNKLHEQFAIIRLLKKKQADLTNPTDSTGQLIKYMEVKIGSKIKMVELKDIIWIQADDYCAKIHSINNETFIVRKSLKALENELSALRFVRIHRTALLNLDYMNTIDTRNSTVRLVNSDEIPISKTGLRSLRRKVT